MIEGNEIDKYVKIKKNSREFIVTTRWCLLIFIVYSVVAFVFDIDINSYIPLIFVVGFYSGSLFSNTFLKKLFDLVDVRINQDPELLERYLFLQPKTPRSLIGELYIRVKSKLAMKQKDLSYNWVCPACKRTNDADTNKCEICKCPSSASAKEIEQYT